MDDPRYIVVTKTAPNFFDRLYFAVIDTHNGNRKTCMACH
jgi:hypothetical protein